MCVYWLPTAYGEATSPRWAGATSPRPPEMPSAPGAPGKARRPGAAAAPGRSRVHVAGPPVDDLRVPHRVRPGSERTWSGERWRACGSPRLRLVVDRRTTRRLLIKRNGRSVFTLVTCIRSLTIRVTVGLLQ